MADQKSTHEEVADTVDATTGETKMSVGSYLASRLPTLKPPMNKAPNPIRVLGMLNRQQWLFFLVCKLLFMINIIIFN